MVAEAAPTEAAAQCIKVKALGAVTKIAVAPDDRHVYVATETPRS